MKKLTRIAYNSANWRYPTGDAKESKDTFYGQHGYGHEEWLFRNEWVIDGWRYAFLQGVNDSYRKLLRENKPFDVTLFSIQPDKKRRYVAQISSVECLDNTQAKDAVALFREYGWFDQMIEGIRKVKGNIGAFANVDWTAELLNIRFRLENLSFFPEGTYVASSDRIYKSRLGRYLLYDLNDFPDEQHSDQSNANAPHRGGSEEFPSTQSHGRTSRHTSITVTPEHSRMQKKLMEELTLEFAGFGIKPIREENFIDVTVKTNTDIWLFEIKSDLSPRMVIRQALGQLLEYAYFHQGQWENLQLHLVIVGRKALTSPEADYIKRLRELYQLPIEYRQVKI